MSQQMYNWKRFWVARTGKVVLTSDGYLVDPESEYGKWTTSDVTDFSALTAYSCLVLLGEPGMGKSVALHQASVSRRVESTRTRDQSEYIDLRAYGSEDRIVREVFRSQKVQSWQDGDYKLDLFLDSLDECLLRVDTLSALLAEELRKLPLTRLKLHIASRTADWPQSLESGLRGLFGDENVGVFELAPLRRVDVIEAAVGRGVDVDQFLAGVGTAHAAPLAIRPVTLSFLLDTFRVHKALPASRYQLYLDGCRLLCEETNQGRRESRLSRTLSADERLMSAARMAAVTVFGNRYAIWAGVQSGVIPSEDVTLRLMAGGSEEWAGHQPLSVSESVLREALSTGLFTSRGPSRFGWAHHTYAEFLAAYYLIMKRVSLTQVMSLLRHPDDPTGKLVPQLHEISAWLASQTPEIWREIMRSDPEVLLRSDVASVTDFEKEKLVEAFLQATAEGALIVTPQFHSLYPRLDHRNLAQQLTAWLSNRSVGLAARHAAIDIAEECAVRELQSLLVDLALDSTEAMYLRVNAAYAVTQIGDEQSRRRLRPLALGQAGDDPDDELKGCGLLATWPGHLTAEELFTHLGPPKRKSLLGIYQALFLNKDLVENLEPSDLPVALEWVAKYVSRSRGDGPLEAIRVAILKKTSKFLGDPRLGEALGRALTAWLTSHRELPIELRSAFQANSAARVDLVQELLGGSLAPWSIARSGLIQGDDLEFILSRAQVGSTDGTRWIQLLRFIVDPQDRSQVDKVYATSTLHPYLIEELPWLLKPVQLSSDRAEELRKEFEERQRWESQAVRPKPNPSPKDRIATLLDRFESGDTAAWWRLNWVMTFNDDGTSHCDDLESDITALPGWINAAPSTRERIVAAAANYISDHKLNTKKWWGTNVFHRADFSGYRALLLIDQLQPGVLQGFESTVWEKWVPVIMSYPISFGTGDEGRHIALATVAYRHAPQGCIDCLTVQLKHDNKHHDHFFAHRRLAGVWDPAIEKAFLALVMDGNTKATNMSDLLDLLLDHGVESAREYAASLIRDKSDPQRALWAGVSLANHSPGASWDVIWPEIIDDPQFGREFCMTVASAHRSSVLVRLDEHQLRDLYIWLVNHFPHHEDPQHEGAHYVGARESVADWRDQILRLLQSKGTRPAVEALQEIVDRLPELPWLRRLLVDAWETYRRVSWTPPAPSEILGVVSDGAARLIRSGDELLCVVLESLDRLQVNLQAETPAAVDLWNTGSVIAHKDENDLSNYLKRFLTSDLARSGLILNREVEIRRGYREGSGERVDLLGQTVPKNGTDFHDSMSLVIEVKGSWNPRLKVDMEEQLKERYLRDSRCRHGLYLVGWFPKIGKGSREELENLRRDLALQGQQLSTDAVRISAYVLDCSLR